MNHDVKGQNKERNIIEWGVFNEFNLEGPLKKKKKKRKIKGGGVCQSDSNIQNLIRTTKK